MRGRFSWNFKKGPPLGDWKIGSVDGRLFDAIERMAQETARDAIKSELEQFDIGVITKRKQWRLYVISDWGGVEWPLELVLKMLVDECEPCGADEDYVRLVEMLERTSSAARKALDRHWVKDSIEKTP